MPGVEKLIEKMKLQSHNMHPEEIDKVLEAYGFTKKNQKGSHRRYKNEQTKKTLVIPIKDPIKKYYVTEILEIIGERK